MKVGVIGAGTVGQMHISHFSGIEGCEIIALADLRPELRGLVAKKFGILNQYSSHEELLGNNAIEAVIVCTARHHTGPIVRDCLKKGKHVFSEKPMAKTLDQAQELVDLSEKMGRIYSVGYQRRHDEGTWIAKQEFDRIQETRKLGEITFIRLWNFTGQDREMSNKFEMTPEERPSQPQGPGQAPAWIPKTYHHSYDRFLNVFSHNTNILRYFFGKNPAISYANLEHPQGQLVAYGYKGLSGVFECGLRELKEWKDRGEWNDGLEIMFEKGALEIKYAGTLMHHRSAQVKLTVGNQTTLLNEGQAKYSAFHWQAQCFISQILNNANERGNGADALEDLKVIEEIWSNFLKTGNKHGQ